MLPSHMYHYVFGWMKDHSESRDISDIDVKLCKFLMVMIFFQVNYFENFLNKFIRSVESVAEL